MDSPGARRVWPVAVAITVCATVFTAMQGLTYPLLALILNRLGESEWAIGVNAAMMPLGMIIAAPLAPRMMVRLGGFTVAAWSLIGASLCLLAIGARHDPVLWVPLRLAMGLCLGCILVVTETWINEVTGDEHRGRVLGFYSALLSVGFALGPGLLAAVGSHGWTPFLIGALFPVLALLPLIPVRAGLPVRPADEEPVSVLRFLPLAPLLVLCAGAVALTDEGAMSLLPIYALAHGYSEVAGSVALIVMIAGSVSMQFPIGWLADRVSRPTVAVGCAVAAAGSAGLLPLAVTTPVLFGPLIFVWGGSYYAVYMLSLIRLGEAFKGAALVAGNAAFGAMWGAGGIVGPAVAGTAMTAIGPIGFPLVFALVFGGIAVATALSAGTARDS